MTPEEFARVYAAMQQAMELNTARQQKLDKAGSDALRASKTVAANYPEMRKGEVNWDWNRGDPIGDLFRGPINVIKEGLPEWLRDDKRLNDEMGTIGLGEGMAYTAMPLTMALPGSFGVGAIPRMLAGAGLSVAGSVPSYLTDRENSNPLLDAAVGAAFGKGIKPGLAALSALMERSGNAEPDEMQGLVPAYAGGGIVKKASGILQSIKNYLNAPKVDPFEVPKFAIEQGLTEPRLFTPQHEKALEEGWNPDVTYLHGSRRPVVGKYDLTRTRGDNNNLGAGMYLAPMPNVSKHRTSPNTFAGTREGATVHPVITKDAPFLPYRDPMISNREARILKERGEERPRGYSDLLSELGSPAAVREWAKERGYIGVSMDGREFVVFDPSNVRPKFDEETFADGGLVTKEMFAPSEIMALTDAGLEIPEMLSKAQVEEFLNKLR